MKFINSIAKTFWRFLTKKIEIRERCKGNRTTATEYHGVAQELFTTWLFFSAATRHAGVLSSSRLLRASSGHLFQMLSWPGSFLSMFFLVFGDSIPKRCKGVHCVDLGESFPTSIYLLNLACSLFLFFEKDWTTLLACLLALIQPRTRLSKFAKN